MKLPQSLTTVTTFSKILALLLFIVFILGAFRLGMKYQRLVDMKAVPTVALSPTHSAGSGSPTNSSPSAVQENAQTITITQDDNGKTIGTKVGDKVLVSLSDSLNWTVSLSNNTVLQAAPDGVFYIHPTQGRYRAVAPGTVDVIAQGRVKCGKGQMCSMAIILFKATVAVSQ